MLNRWAEDDCDLPYGVLTYVMYHGTSSRNAELVKRSGFQQSTDGMLGRGVYLSRDPQKASCYPLNHPEKDKDIIQVQVNVGRVKRINYQRHPLQKTWHDHGYYTAWVPPNCGMVPSGLEEDCVWDPRRIKVLKFKATAMYYFCLPYRIHYHVGIIVVHHHHYNPYNITLYQSV
uniref:Grass carp reovirus (GCRV)-induced gene 2e n=1 Tax=Neogobius melanostomus TaxID=47308 RepID=A0A8C6UFQ8_9GOBI